ncbi:leupeptin-inactivating enzyme 1 precursor [Didymella exigua CBS 183.55]|uniref:Peptide hydrolase n=1 Tax=Didymella exigua CBS 183.55 TaxID=1150837 RepID=A0A6A5S3A9_9PLEO|nr:leupeptin-inactivating enzyme 1 precursor [Didymella exigua CBS 183.55]KAF1932956.1 leupeptin-inactivating enzyme 1 precursor [Didymella exigua CBS 183.55]
MAAVDMNEGRRQDSMTGHFLQHSCRLITAAAACATTFAHAAALLSRANSTEKLVTSVTLRYLLDIDNLYAKAEHLQSIAYRSAGKNRVIGSKGHEDTVRWIKETLDQGFPLLVGVSTNLAANNKTIEAFPTTLAPEGDVSGPLADFTDSLEGKIALINRGTCFFGVKVQFAAAKGALDVIAWNNCEGTLEGYSLQLFEDPANPYVPTVGITLGQGESLGAQIQAGVDIFVHLKSVVQNATSYNVIAETIAGDHDNVIHVGGHFDSVTAGSAINDNGSGSISILEIAIQLRKFTVNNAAGLLGAEYYVKQLSQADKDNIRLFLGFDMMASPNYAIQIYDGDAEHEFAAYFDNLGLNHTEAEFDGRSDYGPFLKAGITAGGIAGGVEGIKTQEEFEMFGGGAGVPYDVNYHKDGDTVSNLNLKAWIEFARAIAHMAATYARSWETIPPRNATALVKRSEKHNQYKQAFQKAKRYQKWA